MANRLAADDAVVQHTPVNREITARSVRQRPNAVTAARRPAVASVIAAVAVAAAIATAIGSAATSSTATAQIVAEKTFAEKRRAVLNAPAADLRAIGPHLMAGYHALWQLKPLLQRGALGGVFITGHNARRKSFNRLKEEIARIQDMALLTRITPLWISADHEGGLVSKLAPPLRRPPSLRRLIRASSVARFDGDRSAAVTAYAASKASALHQLGVNINFAPVLDLRPAKRIRGDRRTLLRRRAISNDPLTVASVAADYCEALLANGVLCTLKHFPGLARLSADTHMRGARLSASKDTLASTDWKPFRSVLQRTTAPVMVGHPIAIAIDRTKPASLSKSVIDGVLRSEWGHRGLVITDDLWMGAVRKRRGGMPKAAISALNAGADIVLICRDANELYPVFYALLQAYQSGRLDRDMLTRSKARLADAAQRLKRYKSATAPAAEAVRLPRMRPAPKAHQVRAPQPVLVR
ncbi:MAG: glycoside hydrolase family 3 N-terminal domain-containing protein [Pseudomonadota bacterium]